MANDRCDYPRCRRGMAITVQGNIDLCEIHMRAWYRIEPKGLERKDWERFELAMLRFQQKCGLRSAARRISKLKENPAKYDFQFVAISSPESENVGGAGEPPGEERVDHAEEEFNKYFGEERNDEG